MKRLLLIFGLFLCAIPSHAAIAHTQSAAGFCNGGSHTANFTSNCATVTTATFTFTATAANEAVVFRIGCNGTTETTVTLAATGWTITSLSGVTGASGSRLASFGAISPNTTLATFTITWSNTFSFGEDLIDEFSGTDLTGGTTTFDNHAEANGSGTTPTVNVTTNNANDTVTGGCSDSITAVGVGYTKGADDTQQDWSEWKLTTDATSTVETVNFTGSGTWSIAAVTIKPAAGAAASTMPAVVF